MKTKWLILIIVVCTIVTLSVGYISGRQSIHAEQWTKGYGACLSNVVEALTSCDDVYLGNMVITAPNTQVSNVVFFVVDANVMPVIIDANSVVVRDVTIDACGSMGKY